MGQLGVGGLIRERILSLSEGKQEMLGLGQGVMRSALLS